MINLQYTAGKFEYPDSISRRVVVNWIKNIEELPDKIFDLVSNLLKSN